MDPFGQPLNLFTGPRGLSEAYSSQSLCHQTEPYQHNEFKTAWTREGCYLPKVLRL